MKIPLLSVCDTRTLSITLSEGTMKLSISHLSSQANILNSTYPSFRNFDYHSVHVAGAEKIANIAAECGVSNFIHVSHLNASKTSPSKFYQTKAVGEEVVKAAFPSATIVRPSTMFGYEDKLLNNIAGNRITFSQAFFPRSFILLVWPIWWKLNHGQTKIRPVHVCLRHKNI